jgi:hypothetical protein
MNGLKSLIEIIQYDPDTMIDKFFVKKIRLLLEPIRKEAIIDRDEKLLKHFLTKTLIVLLFLGVVFSGGGSS